MTELPPLEIDCPDCTPQHIQDAWTLAHKAWSDEETTAYTEFIAAATRQAVLTEDWYATTTYRDLKDREPSPPGIGCVECDWTQKVMTPAGREVLAFVNRRAAR